MLSLSRILICCHHCCRVLLSCVVVICCCHVLSLSCVVFMCCCHVLSSTRHVSFSYVVVIMCCHVSLSCVVVMCCCDIAGDHSEWPVSYDPATALCSAIPVLQWCPVDSCSLPNACLMLFLATTKSRNTRAGTELCSSGQLRRGWDLHMSQFQFVVTEKFHSFMINIMLVNL